MLTLQDYPTHSDSESVNDQIYFTDRETGQPWDFTDFTASIVVREILARNDFGEIVFQGNETNGQLSWPNGKDGGYLAIEFSPAEIDVPVTGRYARIITFVDDVTGETLEAVSLGSIRKVVP